MHDFCRGALVWSSGLGLWSGVLPWDSGLTSLEKFLSFSKNVKLFL